MRRQFDVIDEMDEYELDEHSHDDNDDDDDDDEHMKGNEVKQQIEKMQEVYKGVDVYNVWRVTIKSMWQKFLFVVRPVTTKRGFKRWKYSRDRDR